MSDIFYNNAASASDAVVERGVHNTLWGGAWVPSAANNLIWKKTGPVVVLFFPFVIINANNNTQPLAMVTQLPVEIRPTRQFNLNMSVVNSTRTTGLVQMDQSGNITIFGDDAEGFFQTGLIAGMDDSTIVYFID